MLTKHLNVLDDNGNVYCRLNNNKLNFTDMKKVRKQCFKCKMFAGTYQGQGVECVWDDSKASKPIMEVTSSDAEYKRINGAS